jgi:hypothetical protein
MTLSDFRRSFARCPLPRSAQILGLAAAAFLTLCLVNSGLAEARGGHGGGFGGHGGGFGGHGGHGGWGGGAALHSGTFHTGGFQTGPRVGASNARPGWARNGGHRFFHRHHRVFVGGVWYDYPYYDDYLYYYDYPASPPGCRIVTTKFGPRQVCHHRHWRHH